MRKTVSWEGEEKLPGIWIEKGALTWGEDRLAVCWNYDWDTLAVASADKFQREEDGRITANIVLNKDHPDVAHVMQLVKDDMVSFAIMADGITRDVVEGDDSANPVHHVTSGRIRGIGMILTSNAAW